MMSLRYKRSKQKHSMMDHPEDINQQPDENGNQTESPKSGQDSPNRSRLRPVSRLHQLTTNQASTIDKPTEDVTTSPTQSRLSQPTTNQASTIDKPTEDVTTSPTQSRLPALSKIPRHPPPKKPKPDMRKERSSISTDLPPEQPSTASNLTHMTQSEPFNSVDDITTTIHSPVKSPKKLVYLGLKSSQGRKPSQQSQPGEITKQQAGYDNESVASQGNNHNHDLQPGAEMTKHKAKYESVASQGNKHTQELQPGAEMTKHKAEYESEGCRNTTLFQNNDTHVINSKLHEPVKQVASIEISKPVPHSPKTPEVINNVVGRNEPVTCDASSCAEGISQTAELADSGTQKPGPHRSHSDSEHYNNQENNATHLSTEDKADESEYLPEELISEDDINTTIKRPLEAEPFDYIYSKSIDDEAVHPCQGSEDNKSDAESSQTTDELTDDSVESVVQNPNKLASSQTMNDVISAKQKNVPILGDMDKPGFPETKVQDGPTSHDVGSQTEIDEYSHNVKLYECLLALSLCTLLAATLVGMFFVYHDNTKQLELEELKQSIGLLTKRLDQDNNIAFKAHHPEGDIGPVTSHSMLSFSIVDVNLGGAFDASTHKFKAPVSGVYQFNYVIRSYGGHIRVVVDGEPAGAGTGTNSGNYDMTVSGSDIVVLMSGQEVWMELLAEPGYKINCSNRQCLFSGFLISKVDND